MQNSGLYPDYSDVCETAYGQSSYVRLVNDIGEVHCTLLGGKSRVVPLKFISISRIELTAATLSVKVYKMLKDELDIYVHDEIFWINSQVIFGYINSNVHHFKVFAANQVQQIPDKTSTKNGIMLKVATT